MTKRVLVFSYDFPPLLGGIARFCAELVNLIKKDPQISCEVLTRTASSKIKRDFLSYQVLRRWRDSDATVICANWYPEGLLAISAGCKNVFILAHGTEILPSRNVLRRPIWQFLKKYTLANAKMVIANSSYTQKLVLEQSPGANVAAIPLGVDTKKFIPAPKTQAKAHLGLSNKKILLTVTRLHRYKGIETVLKSIARLPAKTKEKFEYLIGGEGSFKPALIKLVEELKISNCVRFLGTLSEESLLTYYQAADLFLLCSWEERLEQNVEGFGLVFLEAQACGTPVIGTISGGIPSAVKENHGGWLIPERNDEKLAHLLEKLVENDDILQNQGLEARRRTEQECTWDQYYVKLKKLIG